MWRLGLCLLGVTVLATAGPARAEDWKPSPGEAKTFYDADFMARAATPAATRPIVVFRLRVMTLFLPGGGVRIRPISFLRPSSDPAAERRLNGAVSFGDRGLRS